ncbi:MAG: shikimate kinase [Clostridiales bacterium]|nr:shikimate kinase [Clostridiales bacterium]
MAKNIVLIGMMGCGKTTVGGLLARRLGRELVDTDALIEQRQGRSIPDIFAQEGEAHFRALELELCRGSSGQDGLIIACGGGLPLQDEAIAALKENGVVFWLDRDPGETYDALDVSGRPLAQAGREDFVRRYQDRAPIYRRWADYIIPCGDGPQAVEQLISTIYREVSKP